MKDLLYTVLNNNELIKLVLSSPKATNGIIKISIRPLIIKNKTVYQAEETKKGQTFHRNMNEKECFEYILEQLQAFKQAFLHSSLADYHFLTGKKGNLTLLKKAPAKTLQETVHNRAKKHLFQDGVPIPFLIQLGIMNAEGKVHAAKQDKFRQINRFLEFVEDILPQLEGNQNTLQVVDFGCGKAYLTFALFHFLSVTKALPISMKGIDLKQEVIAFCQKLAKDVGFHENLQFICGNIESIPLEQNMDLAVSLHACDTATDAALEKAIRAGAKVILAVPCCQHELLSQIKQKAFFPLLKHGILKERFAALATDAARAQLLEAFGYKTQVLEFIDMEHTAKNLLIRAVKKNSSLDSKRKAFQKYLEFKNNLDIFPNLEKRIGMLINQQIY